MHLIGLSAQAARVPSARGAREGLGAPQTDSFVFLVTRVQETHHCPPCLVTLCVAFGRLLFRAERTGVAALPLRRFRRTALLRLGRFHGYLALGVLRLMLRRWQ